jgi:hypothetical protein
MHWFGCGFIWFFGLGLFLVAVWLWCSLIASINNIGAMLRVVVVELNSEGVLLF